MRWRQVQISGKDVSNDVWRIMGILKTMLCFINNQKYCWLLQLPLLSILSVCKHDFSKKALSNINVTADVS